VTSVCNIPLFIISILPEARKEFLKDAPDVYDHGAKFDNTVV
jgi:hypothetical protein